MNEYAKRRLFRGINLTAIRAGMAIPDVSPDAEQREVEARLDRDREAGEGGTLAPFTRYGWGREEAALARNERTLLRA